MSVFLEREAAVTTESEEEVGLELGFEVASGQPTSHFTEILYFFAFIHPILPDSARKNFILGLIQQKLNDLAPQTFAHIEAARTRGTNQQLAAIREAMLKIFQDLAENAGVDLRFNDVEFLLVSMGENGSNPSGNKECFGQLDVGYPIKLFEQIVGGNGEKKEWIYRNFSIAFRVERQKLSPRVQVFIWPT